MAGKELSDKIKELAKPKCKEELILMGAEFVEFNNEPLYATIMRDEYTATFSYRNGWYQLHDYHDIKQSITGHDLRK